jgi:hypothetical protein
MRVLMCNICDLNKFLFFLSLLLAFWLFLKISYVGVGCQMILLLHLVSTGTLGQLGIPKWPPSHVWRLVLTAGFLPKSSVIFLICFSMCLLGLPDSLEVSE